MVELIWILFSLPYIYLHYDDEDGGADVEAEDSPLACCEKMIDVPHLRNKFLHGISTNKDTNEDRITVIQTFPIRMWNNMSQLE